jgi:hypothetical protein
LRRITSILLASAFLLTACARNAQAKVAPVPKSIPVSDTVTEPAPTNECLNCHTDQQMLIDTAKPEEVQVKESSGTG